MGRAPWRACRRWARSSCTRGPSRSTRRRSWPRRAAATSSSPTGRRPARRRCSPALPDLVAVCRVAVDIRNIDVEARQRARRSRHAGKPQLGAGGERAGDRADDRHRPRHLARRCRLQGGQRAGGRHGAAARGRHRRHHRLWPPRPARRRAGAGLRHEGAGQRSLRHRRARRDRAGRARRVAASAPTSCCRWRWRRRRPRT